MIAVVPTKDACFLQTGHYAAYSFSILKILFNTPLNFVLHLLHVISFVE
jgi:hypothetical protein